MRRHPSRTVLALAALRPGFAVPFLYYGIQAAAAPSFPDFSLVGTTASELGSDRSERPAVFNAGIIVLGTVTLAAAVGFLLALRRLGARPLLAWATAAAVPSTGCRRCGLGSSRCPTRGTAGTQRSSGACSCCRSCSPQRPGDRPAAGGAGLLRRHPGPAGRYGPGHERGERAGHARLPRAGAEGVHPGRLPADRRRGVRSGPTGLGVARLTVRRRRVRCLCRGGVADNSSG